MQIDLNKYKHFVQTVTSAESNNYDHLNRRIENLRKENPPVNVSLLLTAGLGLGSEGGEFQEIVKT